MLGSLTRLFRTPQHRYEPVPNTSRDGSFEETKFSPTNFDSNKQKTETPSKIGELVVLLCAVCVFGNLLLGWFLKHPIPLENTDMSLLQSKASVETSERRPSQYVGLDAVIRPAQFIDKEVINFPIAVGTVNAKASHKVSIGRRGEQKILSSTSSFVSDKIEVTASTSTLIQFRTIDWGMEDCVLHIQLPSGHDSVINPISLEIIDSGSQIADGVDWSPNLEASRRIAMAHGTTHSQWTYRFPCVTDSLYTFKLSASTDDTRVEWWQDKQSLSPGAYIIQHATK